MGGQPAQAGHVGRHATRGGGDLSIGFGGWCWGGALARAVNDEVDKRSEPEGVNNEVDNRKLKNWGARFLGAIAYRSGHDHEPPPRPRTKRERGRNATPVADRSQCGPYVTVPCASRATTNIR